MWRWATSTEDGTTLTPVAATSKREVFGGCWGTPPTMVVGTDVDDAAGKGVGIEGVPDGVKF